MDRQYADVLLPLKDNLTNKLFGHKYIQKLSKGTISTYAVPNEVTFCFLFLRLSQGSYLATKCQLIPTTFFFQLGILLNSMKRLLDVLLPKIENQLKSWSSCIPDDGHKVIGEYLDDVTVMLRAKFRNYRQAIVEKLSANVSRESSSTSSFLVQLFSLL